MYLSVCQSVFLSACLFVCLFSVLFLSLFLSVCMSIVSVWGYYSCLKILWLCYSGWPLALTRVFLWWTQSPTNASTSSATSPASCVSMQLAIYLFFLHFFISAYTGADLTNQDVRRGSVPATFSPKPTVMKHPSLRSMSTQQFRVICLCCVILPYIPTPYFISSIEWCG